MIEKKDYKEIAKINKEHYFCFRDMRQYKIFCNNQADYFEKESENKEMTIVAPQRCKDVFNRKQFLKDCGVI